MERHPLIWLHLKEPGLRPPNQDVDVTFFRYVFLATTNQTWDVSVMFWLCSYLTSPNQNITVKFFLGFALPYQILISLLCTVYAHACIHNLTVSLKGRSHSAMRWILTQWKICTMFTELSIKALKKNGRNNVKKISWSIGIESLHRK